MHMRRLALVSSPDDIGGAPARRAGERQAPTLRIAVASRDGRAVNAHFGSAKRFVVYDITETTSRLVETVSFEDVSDESGEHTREGDDKNGAKINALAGVGLLVVQAIGGPVAARVIGSGIHPIKLTNNEPIEEIIEKVQTMLAGDPPPWLRKVLQQRQDRNMDFLNEED